MVVIKMISLETGISRSVDISKAGSNIASLGPETSLQKGSSLHL